MSYDDYEDYNEDEKEFDYEEDKDFKEEGEEELWKDFEPDINEIAAYKDLERIGMAKIIGVDEFDEFGTSRSPEDMFKFIAFSIKNKYKLDDSDYKNALSMVNILKQKNRGLRYKSPAAIIFALKCIDNKKIDKNKLQTVYQKYAIQEKMEIQDLLRYCFLILDIL